MLLRCSNGNASRAAIRQYICPSCLTQFRSQRRRFSISPRLSANPEPKTYAILGGGITGLSTAFYLSRELPDARITIYEKSKRLGGWIDSERVGVDGGEVIFEHGPHTLRPSIGAGLVPLEMIKLLNLEDELIRISANSAAARNRFIYYPDHLVRMPSVLPGASLLMNMTRNMMTILSEPIFDGINFGWSLLKEPWRSARADRDPLGDESVGSFISRRFSPAIADNLLSAVFHGIYAGDIYQLSAKSLLPLLYKLELEDSRVLLGLITKSLQGHVLSENDYWLAFDFLEGHPPTPPQAARESLKPSLGNARFDANRLPKIAGTNAYTMKGGTGRLVQELERYLREAKNVNIETEVDIMDITQIAQSKDLKFTFAQTKAKKAPKSHNYLVSTINPSILRKYLESVKSQRESTSHILVDDTHAVTVMVVNLWYSDPRLLPAQGFGYLIPRSIPYEQNPEHALGVIFASEAGPGQDSAPGTKLTVMFGGHWWDDWDAFPTADEGIQMAQSVVARHLNIQQKPGLTSVRLQERCIPQYRVGHVRNMLNLNTYLATYDNRIKVAGSWFTGVGVADCARSGRDVALGFKQGNTDNLGLDGILPTTPGFEKFRNLYGSAEDGRRLPVRMP